MNKILKKKKLMRTFKRRKDLQDMFSPLHRGHYIKHSKKLLAITQNAKGAIIPLDTRIYDLLLERLELIENIET